MHLKLDKAISLQMCLQVKLRSKGLQKCINLRLITERSRINHQIKNIKNKFHCQVLTGNPLKKRQGVSIHNKLIAFINLKAFPVALFSPRDVDKNTNIWTSFEMQTLTGLLLKHIQFFLFPFAINGHHHRLVVMQFAIQSKDRNEEKLMQCMARFYVVYW